jgi:hypothetical protein
VDERGFCYGVVAYVTGRKSGTSYTNFVIGVGMNYLKPEFHITIFNPYPDNVQNMAGF